MTLSVVGGSSIVGVTRRMCDVVVVGSGGGGAPAALELANAGLDVVVLEAGPLIKPEEFSQRVLDSVRRVYVDKGAQQTSNGLVAILQGSCVGGSTVVNAEVCFPIPDYVLQEWARDFGVRGLDPAAMGPIFDEVMVHLNATTNTEHYMNAGSLVRGGFDALGLDAQPAKRSVKGCKGCNYCFFGCAYGCKQSMDQSYLPRAVAAGATLYSEARVETIDRGGSHVRGVTARTPFGSLIVEASAVVLACGAIATPLLLADNGLGGPKVGHHLALHPVLGPFGFYDEEHADRPNAMIPFYSKAYEQEGFLLEVFSTPLEFFAPFVPGFGAEHRALVRDMKRYGGIGAIIRDSPGPGRVYRNKKGRKVIDYDFTPDIEARVRRAIRRVTEIHFAAGARKVVLPTLDLQMLTPADDLSIIDRIRIGAADSPFVSYHPQGTARIGEVTDSDARVNGTDNLYVMDTSLFPTPVGVNTQVPVMGVATHMARKLAARMR